MEYVHSEYAGNLADCHKHQLLCYLLATSPTRYLETHAGAGCYRLRDGGRWQHGLGPLWPLSAAALNADWVAALKALNPGELQCYPGSPWLARQLLGAERLTLFELDMAVSDQLRETLPEVDVRTGDGFSSVVHLLEPGCLVLVDPPYTELDEFDRALMLVSLAVQRGDCGLMLWYPRFSDQRELGFLAELAALLEGCGWQHELCFSEPQGALCGSGVAVVGIDQPELAVLQGISRVLRG